MKARYGRIVRMSILRALPRLLALAALVGGGLGAQPAAGTAVDPFDQIKQMRRGVNIIGYDPIWRNFESARFKERHFQRIHAGGFQTVRINLQAFSHMDAENRLNPVWFTTLDWAVKNALANNLTVILDEHDYGVCGNDAERPLRTPERTERQIDARALECLAEGGAGDGPQDQSQAQRGHRPGVVEQHPLPGQTGAAAGRPEHRRHGSLLPPDGVYPD